jgi:hypothetical protein
MSCKDKNTIVEWVPKYVRPCTPPPLEPCNKDCLRIKFIIYPTIDFSFKINELIYSNNNYNLSNISNNDYWISIKPKKESEYIWCTPFLTLNNSGEKYVLQIKFSDIDEPMINIDDVSLQTYTTGFYVYDKITQTLTIDTEV